MFARAQWFPAGFLAVAMAGVVSCRRPVSPPADTARNLPAPLTNSRPAAEGAAPPLRYGGCMTGDEGLKALIQNPEQNLGTFKAIGQDAFGYTILEINPAWVVLEREGKTFRLPLHE